MQDVAEKNLLNLINIRLTFKTCTMHYFDLYLLTVYEHIATFRVDTFLLIQSAEKTPTSLEMNPVSALRLNH